MPYVTMKQSPAYHQLTFEEVLGGAVSTPTMVSKNESNTRTWFKMNLDQKFLDLFDFDAMIATLQDFYNRHKNLYEVDRQSLYDKFFIPKKSGGLREINAPQPELMDALRELKRIFEEQMFALYHTSAFAYVKDRSTIDAVRRHQQNESNWFLKTDFSNFFGSTTLEFLFRMMCMIFPYSEIVKRPFGADALKNCLNLCFLNGGLPQGTPISPMLTNLMMIPIDHRLYNCLRKFNGVYFVYTRYADDILVSSRAAFDADQIVGFINQTLEEFRAPFKIKDEKTRYGSRAGSNWNLGVMLNKDNNITIGQKNKQRLRAMLNNYILDRKNGVKWDLHDVQVMRGHLNYYRMVEPEYVDSVIVYNNNKHSVNVMKMINDDLSM